MLVLVDRVLEGHIENLCAQAPIIALRGITRLLQAHAEGCHVVVIPQSICRILEGCARLSEEHRVMAKKIRAKFPELAELRNVLNVHAVVTADGVVPTRNGSVWNLPLPWIAEHGLRETSLVCEDLYDCEVSQEAARDYLNFSSLPTLMLRFDQTPGGGGNTHRVLKKEAIDSQRVCICVVDSDRDEPSGTGPYGDTATNCLRVTDPGFYQIYISEGRELENHLPAKLVDHIRPTWEGKKPSERYAELTQRCQYVMLFADLKSGIKRKDIDYMTGNSHVYWNATIVRLGQAIKCCGAGCGAGKPGDCGHSVVAPLGRKLLSDARDYLHVGRTNPKRYKSYLPSQNDSFWREMGKLVASYGIALKGTACI